MHRFFVLDDECVAFPDGTRPSRSPWPVGAEVELSLDDANHIARVLRLQPGQRVTVCDGRANDYTARLVHVDARTVRARVESTRPSAAEPEVTVTLAQGIAKGSKMDFIIQKAVEIGVSHIIPLTTKRTVVKLNGKKADSRLKRWRRIAYEAAKQSGRGRVPTVYPIHTWSQLWQRDDLGGVVVPWEGAAVGGGRGETVRGSLQHNPNTVSVVIGPEGGLTAQEIAVAEGHGARPVTLGPRILRTETAAIVATALVLNSCGELG